MSNASRQPRRLSLLRGGLYASGNFAKNIVWGASELALLFIFTEILGLNPAVAGAVILASLVWDALLDPFVGVLADRIGRFGPLIWAGAPVLGLSFVAVLAGPSLGLDEVLLAGAALFALRTAYSLVDIPHNALIGRMAISPADRTTLASARFMFSAAATFVLGLTLPPLLAIEPAAAAQHAIAGWALGFGALATALLLVSAWAAAPWDQPQPARIAATLPAVLHHLLKPLQQRDVQLVLCLAFLGNALTSALAKTALYFADKVLGDAALAGSAIMAIAIGQIAGAPLWIWAARKVAVRQALLIAHGVAGVCALPLLAGQALPKEAFILAAGLYGVGAAGVYTLIWPLAAAAADSSESDAGPSGGAVFGLTIMVMQLASGIGTSLIGLTLAAVGYGPDALPSPAVVSAIAAMAAGPFVATIFAAITIWWFSRRA